MNDIYINPKNVNELNKFGYTVINDFFDYDTDILPIQNEIMNVIFFVAKRHGINLNYQKKFSKNFSYFFNNLIKIDRKHGSEVYDLIKQIPSFLRLVSGKKSEELFCKLRNTENSGISPGSYGIRIDLPNEDEFLAHWHQEFFYQPQSIDGLVFWTPLVNITNEIGPVKILEKSHKDNLQYYCKNKKYSFKKGAYNWGIFQEEKVIKKYFEVSPLTKPTDLVVMDYLTIHSSGKNISNFPRWSIQYRYFNFMDTVGTKIGWKSSVNHANEIKTLFPQNIKVDT